MSLDNKIALVSGGSRGIGKAIALALGGQGATVVATATSESGANNISQYLQEANIPGTGLVLDVANQDSINQMYEQLTERYGMPDILVNNAAITQDNLMLRMKDEEWDKVIATNLSSAYHMTKPCLRNMMKKRWGRIISISSVVGFSGNFGQTNYAAAKMGLVGFSKSLAHEISSRNITVNVVAPGFIETDMTKTIPEEQAEQLKAKIAMGRLGAADEVASAVKFLASCEASYITGETIHVNGGMYMD